MKPLIAIHQRAGSFSERWIEYCHEMEIPYRLVDATNPSIIDKMSDCAGFLWHWSHSDPASALFARSLTHALELMGVIVYPNVATAWHYDDKIAQKYLLEAIGAPMAKTWVFYDPVEADRWLSSCTFPVVAKLRKGAGSKNVHLIKNKNQGERWIKKVFANGINPRPSPFADGKWRVARKTRELGVPGFIARAPKLTWAWIARSVGQSIGYDHFPVERGYVYFQEFMPDNAYDTRVIIVGDRGCALRRYNRPGDFKASGSGLLDRTAEHIDTDMVRIGFDLAQRMGAQSLAIDFVYDRDGHPVILEISYCFPAKFCAGYPGYFDRNLEWHDESIDLREAIVDDVMAMVESPMRSSLAGTVTRQSIA